MRVLHLALVLLLAFHLVAALPGRDHEDHDDDDDHDDDEDDEVEKSPDESKRRETFFLFLPRIIF
jgi:hypothetical protein